MPRHPDPSNTTLIASAETPKSDTITTPTPRLIASSAAVEDTVTNPAAESNSTDIAPLLNRIGRLLGWGSSVSKLSATSMPYTSG